MDSASRGLVGDVAFAVSLEERRRLLEANVAAARFFRQELLRATGGWPVEYLRAAGVEAVMAVGSAWSVGYAPEAPWAMVDHLRAQGFGFGTNWPPSMFRF